MTEFQEKMSFFLELTTLKIRLQISGHMEEMPTAKHPRVSDWVTSWRLCLWAHREKVKHVIT